MRRLWLSWVSAVFAVGICIGTGLVLGWGWWYSDNQLLRIQTGALLGGSLSIGSEPGNIEFDGVWCQGGIQQIWGLGVPLWRLPFEALARVFGQSPFPDRLALAVAIALVCYLVLRVFLMPWNARRVLAYVKRRPDMLAVALVLVLFPPFLTLCRSWFHVYEEVEAYTYLAGIALFAGTLSFTRRPTPARFAVLAFFAGLAPLVRPTLLPYSLASVLIACARLKNLSWPPRRWVAGIGLFGFGGALLFLTNLLRFGSGLEFGHSLNLNNVYTLCYASRFGYPYAAEPLASAARELFSCLFLLPDSALILRGHEKAFFPGQSQTFRWREFYFSTYDLTFLLACIGAGAALLWALGSSRRNNSTSGYALSEIKIMGAWSLISLVPLVWFYLRFQTITSRYLVDFAPAFAAAICTCVQATKAFLPARVWKLGKIAYVQCALLIVWCGYEVITAKHLPQAKGPRTLSYAEVYSRAYRQAHSEPAQWTVPEFYALGVNRIRSGIPYNGAFWNPRTGQTRAAVALFVRDPEYLEIEVMPDNGVEVSDLDWSAIRAKIGFEFLKLERCIDTAEGKRLVFEGPKKRVHQTGIQVAFLGFVAPKDLDEGTTKFRLIQVRWRRDR